MRFLLLLFAGCFSSPSVVLTYTLDAPDDGTDYSRYASAWAEIGIVESTSGDVHIQLSRVPNLVERYGTDALSNRDDDTIAIDTRLTGLQLCIAVAHEIGHIVLDTPRHTVGGVMGGADCRLHDVDRELACEMIGAGCQN